MFEMRAGLVINQELVWLIRNYKISHGNAAGYGIQEDKIGTFISLVNEQFSPDDFRNCYLVDYVLEAKDENLPSLFLSLAKHPECFGNGVDEIKVIVKNVQIHSPFFMGQSKDSTKISYNGIDYVRFKDEVFAFDVKENEGEKMNVFGRLNLNNFAGKTSVQLFIDDYEFVEKNDDRFEF